MPLFVLSFYMVGLKLSYRSSHLKRYKVKQLRKIYKKESKEIILKLKSFKSNEHINEKGDGPYRGFDY